MSLSDAASILVTAPELERFASALLHAGGYTQQEADLTAKSLVLSNLLGHDSHGVIRVSEYIHCLKDDENQSGVELELIHDSATSCQANAHAGLGQVQMPRLLDTLFSKAKIHGVVSGTLLNCGHVGRVGEWSEMIAAHGYAGFVTVNDNGVYRKIAPPGGLEGRTSTNPIAFGIPLKDGDVFSFDFSTSAVAMGKMRLAYMARETCAQGLIQDANGQPSVNPAVLFEEPCGTLLPMGGAQGYKGFGLSMMVDCLTAGLSGGFTPPAPDGTLLYNNVMVTIWNPEFFAGLSHMQDQAEKYLAYVRSTKSIDPAKPVRIPGDRATTEKANRLQGGIPLSIATCRKLLKHAAISNIEPPAALKPLLEKSA